MNGRSNSLILVGTLVIAVLLVLMLGPAIISIMINLRT
jgi:hypothetical protein